MIYQILGAEFIFFFLKNYSIISINKITNSGFLRNYRVFAGVKTELEEVTVQSLLTGHPRKRAPVQCRSDNSDAQAGTLA